MPRKRTDKKLPEAGRGLGEMQTDLAAGSTHKQSDLNMLGRALRENWPIPQEKRQTIVDRVVKVVETGDFDQVTKAAAVLVQMSKVNQADQHHQEDIEAGKKQPDRGPMIVMVDARGNQEHVSLGQYYERTVIDPPEAPAPSVPLPGADPQGPVPEQGR